MSFTKANLIESIKAKLNLPQKQSSDITESILGILKSTLASGEDVLISGFGKFSVNQKNERKGRNPATGEDMMLRPRKVVTFKCSVKLKERLNNTT